MARKKVRVAMLERVLPAATFIAGYNEIQVVEWVSPDDYTLIGFELTAHVDPETNMDSGRIAMDAEITRTSSFGTQGVIGRSEARLECRTAVIGAGTTETVSGRQRAENIVMFPDGHGIDIDEGETINLLTWSQNSMANSHFAYAQAILYLVER